MVEDLFAGGFPDATYVSDRYAGQLRIASARKQLCAPHLMRTSKGLAAAAGDAFWALSLLDVLSDVSRHGALGRVAAPAERRRIRRELKWLVEPKWFDRHGGLSAEAQALRRSLGKRYRQLLTCLRRADVPPDNSASERLLRIVKVKCEVSGGFRSEAGVRVYCKVRSVIETAIRLGVDVLEALKTPGILIPQLAIAE